LASQSRAQGAGSPRVKAARALAKRSQRERARLFLAEGPQSVREALGQGQPGQRGPARPGAGSVVTELFVTGSARARHFELVDAVAAAGIPVHEISGELMAELAQTVTPQGLLAVCSFVDVPMAELTAVAPRLVVVLANARDPGNAGTVLRTADAAGAGGVVFADASVDPYNSKCVRSSAGSLFHVPLVAGIPLTETITQLRRAGLAVLAADGSAAVGLDDLEATGRLGLPTAWVFGNEAWGLPPELLALADESIAVPIYGRAESLNLAAAAAVCLYASARALAQVHDPGGPVQVS
jgi:RNA methyltransferase, TrmH family